MNQVSPLGLLIGLADLFETSVSQVIAETEDLAVPKPEGSQTIATIPANENAERDKAIENKSPC